MQKIRLGADGDLAAAGVEVAVEHGVHQLAALAAVLGRHRPAAVVGEKGHEPIGGAEAQQPVEDLYRRLDVLAEPLSRRAHLLPDGEHQTRRAKRGDRLAPGAADGGGAEILRHVAVERAGQVRHQHRIEPEGFQDFPQLLQVRHGQMAAGQHRHRGRLARRGGFFHQHLQDAQHGGRPTVLESALEVGRRDVDQRGVCKLRVALAGELEIALHIVALGLGESGRAHADDGRARLGVDVHHRLLDVLEAAQHGGNLAHGGGLQRNRFLEVAHEQHHAERRAALRAVQDRHGVGQSHEGQRAADGLAHLERVDRAGLLGVAHRGHQAASTCAVDAASAATGESSVSVLVSQGASCRTCAQMGLVSARCSCLTISTMPT